MIMKEDISRIPLDDSILDDIAGGIYKSNMLTSDHSYVYWDSAEGKDIFGVKTFYKCSDIDAYKAYINAPENANKTDAELIDYFVNTAHIFQVFEG